MKFEQPRATNHTETNTEDTPTVPEALLENTREKIESGKLNAPISLDELHELVAGEPRAEQALNDLLVYASRYASDVWAMKELLSHRNEYPPEEWKEQYDQSDKDRTRLHDTLMDSIAILSRALLAADRDNSWIKQLAPAGKLERPACGSFAIMLTYMQYVNSETPNEDTSHG